MSLSHKHFQKLATALGHAHARIDWADDVSVGDGAMLAREALFDLQGDIVSLCAQDNPEFDGVRFAAHVQKVREDA